MKKTVQNLIAVFIILALCMSCVAFADEESQSSETDAQIIDWDGYSLDELIEIREELSAKIYELQRQWAIEHGDRTITIDREDGPVYKGKTTILTATVEKVLDTAPDTTKLLWESSDPEIATVNATGTVTGVGKGTAVITCFAEDNDAIFAEEEIEIILPVTGIQMEGPDATLLIREGSDENGVQLTASVLPEDAFCQDLIWTSNNEEIAAVDENGYVSGYKPGSVVITAASADEISANIKATCKVNVLQAASSIELSETELVMNLGKTQNITATVLPENTSNKAVIWESSDPEIVAVTNGMLRAVNCGEAVIKATAADGSGVEAECTVTVIQMVTGIKIQEFANPIVLNKDTEMELTEIVLPENATNQEVEWSSSDDSIVSVTDDGVIFGENGGTAVITCSATDGGNVSTTVNVFVPTIAVEETSFEVDSKSGIDIPVHFYGQEGNFDVAASNSGYFFTAKEAGKDDDGAVLVHVDPVRAGRGTVTLIDKGDNKNNRTLDITIGHDAVYDTTSYPVANYTLIMREPNKYDGENLSIYGRVLQKQEGTSGYGFGSYTVMRVATQGRWDNVFYVTCPVWVAEGIIEDDYITVYGECGGTTTYTTVMGGSVTIPELTAEKIILGRG